MFKGEGKTGSDVFFAPNLADRLRVRHKFLIVQFQQAQKLTTIARFS